MISSASLMKMIELGLINVWLYMSCAGVQTCG